jgi:hypothetical protein
MNLNFWTVLKDINKIDVDSESKKTIQNLRQQHKEVMDMAKRYEPEIKDGVVSVSRHQIKMSHRLWAMAGGIREEIESIITTKSK